MAPRPGYGIPLGGISPMAAPDSEIEKLTTLFIGGYHDDWMEKFSRLVVRMMIKKLILKPMKLQENDILLNMRLQGRERCMIQNDKEEEQRRQAKRKTETAFKGRERPTMAT
ncbi:unnamed protein product [Rhizophagus irregularis]|nr:unnamed protein product [Rhizophagus irregularis]